MNHILCKHGHSPFQPAKHRKFDIVQNALMRPVMEAIPLGPSKEAINQGGALAHILGLCAVRVQQIQEGHEDSAIDEQC